MSAVSCERHPVDLIVKRRRDDARRDSRTLRQWGWLHLSNGVKLVDAQEAAQLHIDFLSECTSSANGVRTKVLGNFTPATAPVCAIPVPNTPVPSMIRLYTCEGAP